MQILISPALQAYFSDIQTLQLDISDEEGAEEANLKNMIKVHEKGKRGRLEAMKHLIQFLETSKNPLVLNRKAPAITTFIEWIDSYIKIGRTELERQAGDAAAGRNSAKDD